MNKRKEGCWEWLLNSRHPNFVIAQEKNPLIQIVNATMRTATNSFGILLTGLFLLLQPILVIKSHAHWQHEGVNYSGDTRSIGVVRRVNVPTHYKCSAFVNTTDRSSISGEFEITFSPSLLEIARRDKKTNGTLPYFLNDFTSSKVADTWTNRWHRTYFGLGGLGNYSQIWVVQFRYPDSLKIYQTLVLPYSKEKQHSLYVSSCEAFH